MKKLIYTMLSLLFLQFWAIAQTPIIEEDFLEPVVGWNMEGNWEQEEGYLLLYYYPVVENFDFSAFTPEFYIPDNGGDIILTQFIDVYPANATDEKCEILVVSANEETLIWEHALSDGAWGDIAGTELVLDLNAFSGETVSLRFRSYGASTNAIWGWFVFNINFMSYFDHELCVTDLNGPGNLDTGESGSWQVDVMNLGLNTESGFSVNLYSHKSDQILGSASFDGSLSPGNTTSLNIDWSSEEIHNTVLYATLEMASDEFSDNNISPGSFLRIEPDFDYTVLLWDNDNGIATITSPESGLLQQPHQGLMKMLDIAGIDYDYASSLPDNLEEYNIVISTMGCYCLS